MVSIAAFQAVDPGSIPGHRIIFFNSNNKPCYYQGSSFFFFLRARLAISSAAALVFAWIRKNEEVARWNFTILSKEELNSFLPKNHVFKLIKKRKNREKRNRNTQEFFCCDYPKKIFKNELTKAKSRIFDPNSSTWSYQHISSYFTRSNHFCQKWQFRSLMLIFAYLLTYLGLTFCKNKLTFRPCLNQLAPGFRTAIYLLLTVQNTPQKEANKLQASLKKLKYMRHFLVMR